jgi:hypothetical protein
LGIEHPKLHGFVSRSHGFGLTVLGRFRNVTSSMSGPRYDLEDRLINFAVQICFLTERFPTTPIAKHVSTRTE